MKRIKNIIMRMLPVLVFILATVVLSLSVYHDMISREEDNCWGGLEMATRDVANEMQLRFEDNFKMLDLASDAILMNADMNNTGSVMRYLSNVREETLFDRIDILFPDETLVSQIGGQDKRPDDRRSYNELLREGSHLSTKTIDPYTGKPSFYYFSPVMSEGKPIAILIGAIDCESLSDIFASGHYGGNSKVFMVDRRDGSFLIDKVDKAYGNIYNMEGIELSEKYRDKDYVKEFIDGETSEFAFSVRDNDGIYFMSYMPVEEFPFSVALTIDESVVFKNVLALKEVLIFAGIFELIMLLVFFVWNLYIVFTAVKNQEKAQLAELERVKNQAKTRFLSSVSHDIRTPLNGIIGMLDVIRLKGEVPSHMRDYLHKIDVSAKYLLTLASDVLDLNEIETGKLVFSNDNVDLAELAEDIGIIIQPKAAMNGISYNMDISGLTKPYVIGSGVHINKILMNLIGNALKYNKENGSVWVSIENTDREDGKTDYIFTVRDSGIGMSDEFQKSMFNAFEQEHAGARTQNSGHGLGLSIVSRLVEKMGGKIEVESTKDIGTAIRITIPLAVNDDFSKKADSDTNVTNLAGARILLVEDNDLNMEIANIMLTQAGAEVTAVYNGKVAVDKFNESSPFYYDAILMDIMMPVMDGYEATEKIRSLPRLDSGAVPIIAMTASTFSEDVKKCKECGMNEHIGKPLDMNSVISKVLKHLKSYRGK